MDVPVVKKDTSYTMYAPRRGRRLNFSGITLNSQLHLLFSGVVSAILPSRLAPIRTDSESIVETTIGAHSCGLQKGGKLCMLNMNEKAALGSIVVFRRYPPNTVP